MKRAGILFVVVLALTAVGYVVVEPVKGFVDQYGNLASVLGLLVSVFGFILTLWTVLETRRIEATAQTKLQEQMLKSRQETHRLIAGIRTKVFEETCNQTQFVVTEARHAFESGHWPLAAQRCNEARRYGMRLLQLGILIDSEEQVIRTVVEDIQGAAKAIYEIDAKRGTSPKSTQREIFGPMEVFADALANISSRLFRQPLEP